MLNFMCTQIWYLSHRNGLWLFATALFDILQEKLITRKNGRIIKYGRKRVMKEKKKSKQEQKRRNLMLSGKKCNIERVFSIALSIRHLRVVVERLLLTFRESILVLRLP